MRNFSDVARAIFKKNKQAIIPSEEIRISQNIFKFNFFLTNNFIKTIFSLVVLDDPIPV